MVNGPTILGESGGLRVVIHWRNDYGTEGPVGRTWADLQLWIDDTLAWGALDTAGHSQGIRWSWVELLEFLGNAWAYLVEEEQYPIDFDRDTEIPKHLGELRGRASLRWRRLTEEQAEQEDALLRDFLSVHDLGEALQGAYPPSVLLMRQGRRMLAATKSRAWDLPFSETMATLAALGNIIAQRIESLRDARTELALKRWTARDTLVPLSRLLIATGLDADRLRAIWPLDVEAEAANESLYCLKAAARMTARLVTDEQARAVLAAIQALPFGVPLKLGALGVAAAELMREHESEEAWIQGYLLASLLREHLGTLTGRIDPAQILEDWGVGVREIHMPNTGIDAVAVWGGGRSPTVFVNRVGPRAQVPTGTRSTLAHEVCHLLIDRDGALPVTEVLGGKVPPRIEQRANAFAAELLLPRSAVRADLEEALAFVVQRDARDLAIEATVNRLADTYDASHEMAAWQVLNSGVTGPSDEPALRKKLKSLYHPF